MPNTRRTSRGRRSLSAKMVRSIKDKDNTEESSSKWKESASGTTEGHPSPGNRTVDSGMSSHITCRDVLSSYKEERKHVTLADRRVLKVVGVGDVKFEAASERNVNFLTAKNTLFVPGVADNLISLSKLTENGLRELFKDSIYKVYRKGKLIFRAQAECGIYKITRNVLIPTTEHANPSKDDSAGLWHRRMERINFATLLEL